MVRNVLLVVFTMIASGCGSSFPPLGHVTRIEVHSPMEKHFRTIDDAKEIAPVVEFVDKERDGWGAWWGFYDMFGAPVPEVIADFYDGPRMVREFGVGDGFFEEGSVSKLCGSGEQQEFRNVLGLGKSSSCSNSVK
jgi:hypothetical protein